MGAQRLEDFIHNTKQREQGALSEGDPDADGGTVRTMAQSNYDERAFGRLPVLADALEEVGCTETDILAHFRQPGPHARGCWVIDLILSKDR